MLPEQIKNNFEAYQFTREEALPQAPEAPPLPQLSLFSRALRWIDAQSSVPATILKILAVAVLALSLVGTVLLYRFRQEQRVQEAAERALNALTLAWAQRCISWNRIVSLVEDLGGEEWFKALPFYEDYVRIGPSGDLDQFTWCHLDAPIMKGRDEQGRAFVAFKIKRRGNRNLLESFVCTFFQQSPDANTWAVGSKLGPKTLLPDGNLTVDEAWCQKMRKIREGSDTEYELDTASFIQAQQVQLSPLDSIRKCFDGTTN